MMVRGIRGATTVDEDTSEAIIEATQDLLRALLRDNELQVADVASAIFTTTPDLHSEYPARAARDLGWQHVALLGATEMDMARGLPRCIRVLLHVNTDRAPTSVRHVYLRGAAGLRPDLS